MNIPQDLISTVEAARILGVCTQTIYNYRRRGLLTPIAPMGLGPGKCVLYLRAEVEGFFSRLTSTEK
jgi:hypothetical protein